MISGGKHILKERVYIYVPWRVNLSHHIYRYKFRASDLNDPGFQNRTMMNVPVVLDWAVGNQSCSEAQESNDLACLENSYCVDLDSTVVGYRCLCKEGFEGNPYLSPGCTGTLFYLGICEES